MNEQIVPLSDEQRDFVAQNHKLIYSFAIRHNIDIEEFYDLLAIALCMAAIGYDESMGCFSTYAYASMKKAYGHYLEKQRTLKRTPANGTISLNELVKTSSGKDTTELLDILFDEEAICHADDTFVYVEEFFRTLTPVERIITKGLMLGYPEKEIAKHFQYTRAWVNWEKHKIQKKYYVYLGLENQQ